MCTGVIVYFVPVVCVPMLVYVVLGFFSTPFLLDVLWTEGVL